MVSRKEERKTCLPLLAVRMEEGDVGSSRSLKRPYTDSLGSP